MDLMTAVNTVLKQKYADFSGRARRSEYWYFALAYTIALIGIEIVAFILTAIAKPLGILGFLVLAVVLIGIIVPSLAVSVRRLHDTGKSGWFLLIGLIPFVGGLILLIFTVMDSTPGPNQYGPNPKEGGYGTPPPGYAAPAV
ncbi:MAG: hypothetical protein JWP14_1683 [Frankiales bacterium]|nr:hypothetical protein [Frankiales bacterium]